MAQTGVIIRRNAGTSIPKAYLQKAVEENPTAWGVSVVTPEGLITNSGDDVSVEIFEGTLEDFPDRDITIFLCNNESAINMADVSPFWLVDEGDEPKIIAYVTGNITGYKRPDSSHPGEYHFIEDYLAPKVKNLWEMLDGDIEKIFAQIEKPLFKKDVMNNFVDHGAVTIIANNGKAVSWSIGGKASEYKWGWTSSNYGYAEGPPKQEEQSRRTAFPSKSTVREKASTNQGTATASKSTPAVKNYTVRKMKPRSTDSRQDKKKFYQRYCGFLPKGWENGVEIEVWVDPETNQALTMSDIKGMGLSAVQLAEMPKLNNVRAGEKDTEPTHVNGGDKQTGPAVVTEALPIIPPKSREFLKDMLRREDVKKIIAENGAVLQDISSVKNQEEKFADFSTQLGMKDGIWDFMKLPFEWHLNMAEDKAAIANYAWNLRNMCVALSIKQATKATETDKHVLAKEELKPSKPSMFPKKNVA